MAANYVHFLEEEIFKIFAIEIHVSQPDGQRPLIFTIFCTQGLVLGQG